MLVVLFSPNLSQIRPLYGKSYFSATFFAQIWTLQLDNKSFSTKACILCLTVFLINLMSCLMCIKHDVKTSIDNNWMKYVSHFEYTMTRLVSFDEITQSCYLVTQVSGKNMQLKTTYLVLNTAMSMANNSTCKTCM